MFASIFELRKILESVTGLAKENVDHQVDMIRPYDQKKDFIKKPNFNRK
jgi:hypothetical protein